MRCILYSLTRSSDEIRRPLAVGRDRTRDFPSPPAIFTGRMVAFDLLGLDGAYLVSLPLHERRRQLATILDGGDDGLIFSGHVPGEEGEAFFRHACENNLEGIVSKRVESRYRPGPRFLTKMKAVAA